MVVNLRRSRFGRVLIALRENEANVAAFGVAAVRMRLAAFAFSGALAGFAGAIFAHQQRGLNAESFAATASIDIFVLAVLGGIGSVERRPARRRCTSTSTRYFVTSSRSSPGRRLRRNAAAPLRLAPAGSCRWWPRSATPCLRIVAQRRQIVVPSLFADYDPEALERRLIPLAEASAQQRPRPPCRPTPASAWRPALYQGRGVRIFGRPDDVKEAKEAAAIGAAGTTVGGRVSSAEARTP